MKCLRRHSWLYLSWTMSKGIYIHIPFCVKKCLYCDFCSTADTALREKYVEVLLRDIRAYNGTRADTVFIGGGTPTVLGDGLVSIIKAVKESFCLEKGYELTVEANPGTVNPELLRQMKKAGATRLSIGVQSFNDDELKLLGRIHTKNEAVDAFYTAREAGFDNINIDLMLSTPNQSMESVKKTLDVVEELKPDHVSAYSLIVEEGTPFYDMELNLPDEDIEREIYHYTVERLKAMGLERYEISNFARDGYECRHNIKYWSGDEYIGVGAAAASYVNNYRYTNTYDVASYINGVRAEEREFIDEDERLKEKFLLGFRMSCGVKYNGEFEEQIERLIRQGLLCKDNGFVKLTDKGFDLGNLVFMEFV